MRQGLAAHEVGWTGAELLAVDLSPLILVRAGFRNFKHELSGEMLRNLLDDAVSQVDGESMWRKLSVGAGTSPDVQQHVVLV